MPRDEFYVDPEYRQVLATAGLATFEAFMHCQGGSETSWHLRRTTVPIVLDVGGVKRRFFLKRVFSVGLSERLGALRQGSWSLLPVREWHAVGALRAAGLPAMRAVAYGQRRRLGLPVQAFLLVEAVPAEHNLIQWLLPGESAASAADPSAPAALTPAQRRRLFRAVGNLVGRLHRLGFTWLDLEPKHLHAQLCDNGEGRRVWHLYMIDLERVRQRANCEDQLADLWRLTRAMPALAPTPRESRCFAAGYRQTGPGELLTDERLVHRLTKLWSRHRPYTQPVPWPDDYNATELQPALKCGGLLIHRKDRSALARLGIVDLRSAMTIQNGRPFGRSPLPPWRTRLRLEARTDDGEPVSYYLKRYDRPPLMAQVRRMRELRPRRSTARWDWHQIRELARYGIPAVIVAAFGEHMVGLWERQSVIITRGVPGDPLVTWIPERLASLSPRKRHALARRLGEFVGSFHRLRFHHRSLDLAHLFIGLNRDGTPVFRVVDPGSVFRVKKDDAATWATDLATLRASVAELGRGFTTENEKSRGPGPARRIEHQVLKQSPSISRTEHLCFLVGYFRRNDSKRLRALLRDEGPTR